MSDAKPWTEEEIVEFRTDTTVECRAEWLATLDAERAKLAEVTAERDRAVAILAEVVTLFEHYDGGELQKSGRFLSAVGAAEKLVVSAKMRAGTSKADRGDAPAHAGAAVDDPGEESTADMPGESSEPRLGATRGEVSASRASALAPLSPEETRAMQEVAGSHGLTSRTRDWARDRLMNAPSGDGGSA